MASRPRLVAAIAVASVTGLGGAAVADDPPDPIAEFAAHMFEAIDVRPRPCTAPDEMERRFCAASTFKASKLRSAWDAAVATAEGRWSVEAVTDWKTVKMLVWRYYVVVGRPIVVQANTKSHSLVIVASGLPRCESSLPENTIEIRGGEGERTPPERTYRTVYAWAFRAHKTGLPGKVRLIGTVSAEGKVEDLCLDALDPPIVDVALSAMKSVRKWRFRPATVAGTPTDARVPFAFDLDPERAEKVASF